MRFTGQWTTALAFLFILPTLNSSSGDRDPLFGNCVRKCVKETCDGNPGLPLTLRLTLWSCPDNCKYTCMHQMTELYKQNGHPTLQYYGKWPFTRFMGLQEPASVLFSILNGMNHYKGWKAMRRLPSASEPLKTYYTACGLLGINVWIWSAAFHSRDFSVTEKGDYFSAIGSLLYILFLALIRVFDIQKSQSRHALLGLLGVYFACHVFYLTHWPFDYTYNMAAGVVIGMSSNLTWIYWWIRQRHQRDYAWKQPLLAVLISAAMSLELFDFPPLLGILDAHSLWHMLTIPLVKLHYSFLDSDARYESMVLKGKYRGVPEKDF